MSRHPNIINVIEGTNTITSLLAPKLSRNMRILAETYGKNNHYLYKAASVPILTQATILEMAKCFWCHRRLDDDPDILKSVLTIVNFCGPPTNQSCYRQCVNMETILATSCREEQFGQHIELYKPKTMDSFIRGLKGDFPKLR